MEDERKIQVAGGVILVAPLVGWFLAARLYYGFDQETARGRLWFILTHTFTKPFWPEWVGMGLAEILAIVGLVIAFKLAATPFKGAKFQKFYRGTEIVTQRGLSEKTRSKEPQITMCGVPVPVKAETTHISVGGATGTGKSTIIKEMIVAIKRREMKTGRRERKIILDPDGDYFHTFSRPGDKLLNPFDQRTEGWTFFNEVESDYDFERLAEAIIQPSPSDDSEEWNRYARLLFVEVAKKLKFEGQNLTMAEVFRLTNLAPVEELEEFVAGTPAAALFVKGAEKATGSARFVLSNKLAPHLDMPTGSFSLRGWLTDPDGGDLYITWSDAMRKKLTPLISAWVDMLFSSMLGLEPDLSRRIWTFLDELESLDYLPTLNDALTKGRKKGICVVTGWQAYSQLINVYGEQVAETMLGNHRSIVVMAVGRGGTKTLEHMTKSLGEHEVKRKSHSRSVSLTKAGSASESDRIQKEKAVLESEIMRLDDLNGYLAFPGNLPICRFTLKHQNYIRKDAPPRILYRTTTGIGTNTDAEPFDPAAPPPSAPGSETPLHSPAEHYEMGEETDLLDHDFDE